MSDAIAENAGGPKSVKADGVEVAQHSLPDQIEADKYVRAKAAMVDPTKAFTRVRIVPPGAV